ncbi:MAG: agmatinase family protein [Methylocella sp.]
MLGVLGVPFCKGSITQGRCDLAPYAIRSILGKFTTFDVTQGYNLEELEVKELGDLDIANSLPGDAAEVVTSSVGSALQSVDALVILGGDNSVTRPAFRGLDQPITECALLTLDAHLDLRDLAGGQTNGNPIRGLLEDGLPGHNIVQIGIQSFVNSEPYMEVARSAGIRVIDVEQVRARGIDSVVRESLADLALVARRIYVDFDIDVLDRAFAPACPGSRPGGLLPYELLRAARCCGTNPKVLAVDIVEVDPDKDIAENTVMAAASCLLAFAAGLQARIVNPPASDPSPICPQL